MAEEIQTPSQKELQSRIDSLQAEITRFIVVKQQLIDTQGLLDREQNRFNGIHACGKHLLLVEEIETFTTVLLDSILETFEFEVSLFTRFDNERKCLEVIGQAGFETPPSELAYDIDRFDGNTAVILSSGDELLQKWASAGLAEAIVCPYFTEKEDSLTGLVIGGLTTENLSYYEPISSEIVSSFSVMVTQAGSLLRNYELKEKLQEQNVQLENYNKNLESTVAERTRELREANRELDMLYQQNLGHLRLTREELSYQELLAQTDELTGLHNRRSMDAKLKRLVELSAITIEPFGLLLLDLDTFKSINDTYGHPEGDQVLKAVAHTLRKSCRDTDMLCRLGGDEFAVIMPGISTSRGCEVAERIRSHIEMLPPVQEDKDCRVTASLGGGLYSPSETPEEFVSRVDDYLYEAKRSGRNQVIWKEKTSKEQEHTM